MKIDCLLSVPIVQSPRALQLVGLFDVPPAERSERRVTVDLPIENEAWQVGLIVGRSGSGKSTLAREAFGQHLITGFDWPADRSLVDGFPADMPIKEITGLLSSVGFSSPPSWLRPYACLSNGEQFRATLARAIAESPDLAVIDEFTSVVDRTVAQVGSAAVAKSVRRAGRKLVAVTCHYDVIDWLDPDWVIEMPSGEFTRRALRQRPAIELEVCRVHRSAWELFKPHHYMSGELHKAAKCFVAFFNGQPAAFASTMHATGLKCYWREHRTVCLPDFQGVGIGNKLSEFVASVMKATGKAYHSTTASPAMIRHRQKSPLWRTVRKPSLTRISAGDRSGAKRGIGYAKTRAADRYTAGFEFIGPALPEEARRLGIVASSN